MTGLPSSGSQPSPLPDRGLRTRAGNGHVVREESHLDDMRAAIRGYFERLEERRGEQVLLRPRERSGEGTVTETTSESAAAGEGETLQQTVASEESDGRSGTEGEPRPPGETPDVTLQQTVTSDEVGKQPKRSWIDRLLGL